MNGDTLERRRVLIVDDDQKVLDLLIELLDGEGYEVISARDGSRALALALSSEPDIVICDVVIPVIDGIKLGHLIKQHVGTASVPVLLIGGVSRSDNDGVEGIAADADDYLDLPFRNDELLVKVAKLTERHRVEKYYRKIIERAADIIYTTNMAGFITNINIAGARFFGRSSAEAVGLHLGKLLGAEVAARDIEQTRRVDPKSTLSCSYHLQDGQGVWRYLAGIITVDHDRLGHRTGVRGVLRDVTAQKAAEKALQESKERYRELFENANDIVYTHDISGDFTSLNKSGERVTGYNWEEAAKMNIADLLAPEYLNLAPQLTASEAGGRHATVYELEIVTKHGTRVRLEVSTRVIYHAGKPVGVQGIARDLTERRRSKEALLNYKAFFHSFMDNSPAVAFMKDEDGRYVYVNKPFERLFGPQLKFLRGRTSFDWLPENTAQQTHQNDLQVLLTGEPQRIFETLPARDGSPHEWLVCKFPATDVSGKRFVGGVGVDITEQRRAERSLARQAERQAMTNRISQAVRCSLDSSELLLTAVRELGMYLNVDRCSLLMKDEKTKRTTNVAEYNDPAVQPGAADPDPTDLKVLIESLDENGVLSFNDVAHDKRLTDVDQGILVKPDVRSIMYVAIKVGDEVFAAFALSTTREVRHWSDSDVALAKAVADQTGTAIRQAELYQKAEATSTREALLNRLTVAIRASLSLPEVLSTTTRELGLALAASRVHLHLYNPDNPLSPVEHEYVAPGCSSISHLVVSYDDPIGHHLQISSKPIVIDDALNYSEGPSEFSSSVRAHARKVSLRSQIDCPLIIKGLFRGSLCIHQTDRLRRWSEDEVTLVDAVAARLATGIAQAELFEMVARGKQEWETTFDSMSDGIFIFDRAGQLKRVNLAGAAMEDAHPRALLGQKCCDILRSSATEQGCVVEKAIQEARSVTLEITPERLNRPLLVSVEPVLDKTSNTVAVVCTARDLSELREVQAVAREHQSLLTNILESARESIYAVDTDGRFKWCNSATLAEFGYQREDFIGQHLLDMVHEGDRELVNEKFRTALSGQAQTYEMRYHAPDGGLRYARVDNSPLVVEGRTTGVLGIARDVTEQKEERERAARADKLRALGQLASGVAHDFNNSLAAILGRTQLLRRQTEDDAMVRNLEIIQTAAEDAAATVRRIQTFARKSPAREFERLDVRDLLHDAVEITRTRWENDARLRGIAYQVELEGESGQHTQGSASELREVFVNLIVNAVDAMPRGGKLSIACAREDTRLRLRFADSGTGMTEDVQQKIFEPFFTTKGAQGTGLGLSVSYSIIERHEGSISIASEPGCGAVFTIELPAAEIESSLPPTPAEVEEMPSLSILVIDDEPSVRETLGDMLEAMNHTVVLAEGGPQALQKLVSGEFDLVFTDLAMPEMDGWETARLVRKHWPGIKIVLVTGYGVGTVPPAGECDLVDGVIGKPFDFAQVTETINAVLGRETLLENIGA